MLMFLPGLICDGQIFASQISAFPDALVVNSYGMADSLVEMARIALAEADEHGVQQLDVFGHSMGGRVAMEMFRLAPHRVRRIALVSTGIHPVAPNEAAKRGQLQKIGYESGFAALVDAWLPPLVAEGRHTTPEYAMMRNMCLSKGQAMFDAQIKALLGRPPFEDLLARLRCPALVMTGELDAWAPPSQHEAIAKQIPGSQLVVVEGAGHMIQVEAPDAVNAAIARWLDAPADT